MRLDLGSLTRAIDALGRSLAVGQSMQTAGGVDSALKETVRAGIIQNFEVAFEQCWKFIQRWIRENRTPQEADLLRTRKELFRTAARYGLIEDPVPWFAYGEARNLTAHTYDEHNAEAIARTASDFIGDARYLLAQLEQRND